MAITPATNGIARRAGRSGLSGPARPGCRKRPGGGERGFGAADRARLIDHRAAETPWIDGVRGAIGSGSDPAGASASGLRVLRAGIARGVRTGRPSLDVPAKCGFERGGLPHATVRWIRSLGFSARSSGAVAAGARAPWSGRRTRRQTRRPPRPRSCPPPPAGPAGGPSDARGNDFGLDPCRRSSLGPPGGPTRYRSVDALELVPTGGR